MRLRDIMTTEVETTDHRGSAAAAWTRMRDLRIRHLVVLREGDIVGVLSDRDLGGPRGEATRGGRSVEDLMTRVVVTAAPDATVRDAANLMRGRIVGCLPVVEDGRLLGIVTTSDLLDLLGRGAERPVASAERRSLHRRGPRRGNAPPGAPRG